MQIRLAAGPGRVESRLRCLGRGARDPRRLQDPSAREMGAALGVSAAPGPALHARRGSVEVHAAFRDLIKEHAKIMPEFGTAFGRQHDPRSLPKWRQHVSNAILF